MADDRAVRNTLKTFEGRVAAEFSSELESVAKQLATEAGPPPGAERVHDARAARMWGRTDPKVDHEALRQQLLTTGLSPEQMAASGYAIWQEAPQLVPLYARPVADPAMAEALATLAEYPFRYTLAIEPHDDPREQVRAAEQYDRLWQRQDRQDRQDRQAGIPRGSPAGYPTPVGAPAPAPTGPVVAAPGPEPVPGPTPAAVAPAPAPRPGPDGGPIAPPGG